MARVKIDALRKSYGSAQVIHDIDLDVRDKEFVALVGPSGCGKSTTLRMLAGLEDITGGTISIDDQVINDLDPADRGIAMVFQSYALYPHMSVAKNMSFALRVAGKPKAEIDARVKEAARILHLEEYLDRRPADLSGGQRQRVAMGRAIVRRPDVFLFDEPLSNLDAKLRTQMRTEIKRIHQEVGATTVYVTHDQVEAMTLADRIVIMRGGHIEQAGAPDEVYNHPESEFVASFIGSPPMNLTPAEVADGGLVLEDGTKLPVNLARFEGLSAGDKVTFGLRPDDIVLSGHGMDVNEPWNSKGTVNLSEPLGGETLVFFPFAGSEWIAKMLKPRALKVGEAIDLQFDLSRCHLFDRASGKRINNTK
ncbi:MULTISPECIES: ABC transporter ATP-binding protein [Halocynthiibacter]|uniref:Sn-glycerol-3-phosphate ABC transporter ATP-binding protein UgpC n=1 Tax=Halocynthiibacter halioticoli TaxID=2986804 RepID=A0AAE3LUB1_9RHOB|nr:MULTISPECIES: sn-glycerol-3-phosphate ABC transporter ATP-binding protein UgpC [Halocynthiibacter]MCV6823485.1 sn-glycerol-3-phosphate ABC transporter ATP-binding protein UgpC [Halocynthiibacter halioticoli]MCW4056486.1 sn-glycerol-3-phosphate ABC transporter ATP-binding protein UgpC [Halocynthiibacter sp. SDUM655004]